MSAANPGFLPVAEGRGQRAASPAGATHLRPRDREEFAAQLRPSACGVIRKDHQFAYMTAFVSRTDLDEAAFGSDCGSREQWSELARECATKLISSETWKLSPECESERVREPVAVKRGDCAVNELLAVGDRVAWSGSCGVYDDPQPKVGCQPQLLARKNAPPFRQGFS